MQINELRISSPGDSDDTSNFVEIVATPDTGLTGLTLVVLSGEFAPGQVDFAVDLGAGITDGDGIFLLANPNGGAALDPGDLAAELDFFGSPSTFLLVEGFTGAADDDLDTDDDGVLDITPWTTVLDGVSLIDGDGTPDRSYAATLVGPDGDFAPAGLAARPDGSGAFVPLEFGSFSDDTPGAPNTPPAEPMANVLSPAEVVPQPGASAPTGSGASGRVSAVLDTENGEEVLRYRIALDGLDLVEEPTERVEANDVTGIQFRIGAVGQNGPHALNVFGLPRMDDAQLEIDYDAEVISGVWDDLDANDGGDGVRDGIDSAALSEVRDALLAGEIYVEVQTNAFDLPLTAELRGQVAAITPPEPIRIMEIQGAGHVSPFVDLDLAALPEDTGRVVGDRVATFGVVTAITSDGFYLQDPQGDGDIATSDAIFVETGRREDLIGGAIVEVVGHVAEVFPGGTGSRNLPTTTLLAESVAYQSPAPTVVIEIAETILGADGRLPPSEVIDDDAFAEFDPEGDGIDFFESLEGMLVEIPTGVAVSGTNRFGEIFIVADEAAASGLSDRGTLNISPDDFNPEKIQIDVDADLEGADPLGGAPAPDEAPVIDTLIGVAGVRGVISYEFGNFQVVPTTEFAVTEGPLLGAETTSVLRDARTLTLATYNVLNLDPNEDDGDTDLADGRFDAIAAHIVDNLASPDVIGLQEVQDNSGSDDDGTVAADVTLQLLVDAILAAGGPAYAFIDNDLIVDGASGGQPGGNIRTAFLYNPARVATEQTGNLPEFAGLQEEGEAFAGARLPIAAEFRFTGLAAPDPGGVGTPGTDFLVVNAHFSSKGGSAPILGVEQPFEARQEEVAVNGSLDARQAQAAALDGIIETYTSGALQDLGLAVLGDFNEFEFVSPVSEILPGTGPDGQPRLVNTTELLAEDERYTVIFQGNSQAIDHILLDEDLAPAAEVDIVHVNSEFAATTGRASDHDPVVVGIRYGLAIENYVVGSAEADLLEGTTGVDDIGGYLGDDTILGSRGDDVLNGSFGLDTVVYGSSTFFYTPTLNADGTVTVEKPNGTDDLVYVERIELTDGAYLYDVLESDNLPFVYRTYQAAFARTPDEAGLRFNLDAADAGFPREALADVFIESPEFLEIYGADTSDAEYVELLYLNALAREADQPGLDFWTGVLATDAFTRADMLVFFAESPENVARTLPDIENGAFVSDLEIA